MSYTTIQVENRHLLLKFYNMVLVRVALEQIDTPAKLLAWLCGLGARYHITPRTFRSVVETASAECGYAIPF